MPDFYMSAQLGCMLLHNFYFNALGVLDVHKFAWKNTIISKRDVFTKTPLFSVYASFELIYE